MTETYCVVTFHITQHALLFEDIMKDKGIETKLVPAPREISTSCGTSAIVSCDFKEKILRLCQTEGVPINEFHQIQSKKKSNWFSKLLK